MIDIRLHGRGGQGVVTAANILAWAAYLDGNQSRAIPWYSGERRGAPVLGFIRLDSKPIRLRSQINAPHSVACFDARLPLVVNIFDGLRERGIVLLNSTLSPEETCQQFHLGPDKISKIAVVDATAIAREVLGTPVTNSVMVGCFPKVLDVFTLDSVKEAIRKVMGKMFRDAKIVERNIEAAEAGYERTQVKDLKEG